MKTSHSPFFHSHFAGAQGALQLSVCRLGLATRGESQLQIEDITNALDRGVNFLNWCGCGHADVLSRTVSALGSQRKDVVVCVQFEARTAHEAASELAWILRELNSNYVDALTFYYVEENAEWQQIIAPGGVLEYCRAAQRDGVVRCLGVTSHQRPLAAAMAQSRLLDFLMIRYNAAHRGAETDVFPITDSLNMPVVVYTCLRWGALLRSTPDDPLGFLPPRAPLWYHFALQSPSVSVALMAPENRAELDEDLTVLDRSTPLTPEEYALLVEHGRRVRRHAGSFP